MRSKKAKVHVSRMIISGFIILLLLGIFISFSPLSIVQATESTFGKTTIGASEQSSSANWMIGCRYQLTENGLITHIGFHNAYSSSHTYKVSIYNETESNLPDKLLVQSASQSIAGESWYEWDITDTQLLTGYYYLIVADVLGGQIGFAYDSGYSSPVNQVQGRSYNATDSFPASFGSIDWSSDRAMSIYANYTTIGDTFAPTYSNLVTNTTKAGQSCQFNVTVSDDTALESNGRYQFGTNNTGQWVWDSLVNFTATPQTITTTKTLNYTVGENVAYQWNFTDNLGNFATTSVQILTTTGFVGDYFGENFNDNNLNTVIWEKFSYPNNEDDTLEQNQQLEVTLTNGEIGGINTVEAYDISNANITVALSVAVPIHAQGIYLLSDIFRDASGVRNPESYPALFPLGYYVYKNPIYNTTRIRRNIDNSSWDVISDTAWQSSSGTLSIRIKNGFIYFYDNNVLVYSETFHENIPTTLYVTLYAYADATHQGTAIFDNFIYQSSDYTVYAASGSSADIQDAVDTIALEGGGIVYIPAGSWDFTEEDNWDNVNIDMDDFPNNLTIAGSPTMRTTGQSVPPYGMNPNDQVVEWLTLLNMQWEVPHDGAGADPEDSFFSVSGSNNISQLFRVTDIAFTGYRAFNPASETMYFGIVMTDVGEFRIDHCSFDDIAGSAIRWLVTYEGAMRGVVDHCNVTNSVGIPTPYEDRTVGYGIQQQQYNWQSRWESASEVLGNYTTYTMFIEDCYFEKWRHIFSSSNGQHIVFRHNTVQNDFAYHSFDTHGNYDCPTRAAEVYNNTFLDCIPGWAEGAAQINSGDNCFFYNYVDNSHDHFVWLWWRDGGDATTAKVYLWNNELEGGVTLITGDGTQNVHYFLYERPDYTPYPYPHPLVSGDDAIWYSLTMQSTSGGSVYPAIGTYNLLLGANQTLIATPNTGYYFAGWQIDGEFETYTQNTWYVYMDGEHTAKAYFGVSTTSSSSTTSFTSSTVTSTSTITSTVTTTSSTTSSTSTIQTSSTFTTTYTTSSTLTSSSTSMLVIIGTGNNTFYFRSDTRETNDVTGYALDLANTNSNVSFADSVGDGVIMYYGFDVSLIQYGGNTVSLGEKIGEIQVTNASSAHRLGLWNSPETSLLLGYDAFKVIIYSKIGDGSWIAKATFVTPRIVSSQLYYRTWYFYLYVNRTASTSSVVFGSPTYNSRIEGVGLKEPTDNELQSWRWDAGDTVSFILGAYTDRIGVVAYLVMLLIPSATLYVRHKNTSAVVFAFILFGGPGGLVWFFVPVWAAAVIDLFLVLGYAFLVFKVIR